ncbi:restriction endonuclease subunit S [Lacticaseibacillus paracasei]|uniref:restriction endonuclease subunit S n=1 Tax=Lacticaseibacillus paracasei TaxID=1597 RepID=UPI00234BBA84|nr:restriction endonuclease subunit S [Lacticaseibacillus paracasei]MDC6273587.1 restriction endonuclease subunit S [Lacticaseibacillus paracasei]MDN4553725.1 restriction endonuclease subunit S [Lacticaseibacillus paracasei]
MLARNAWEKRCLSDVLKVNSGRDYKHLSAGTIPVYGTGGYMLSVNKALSNQNAIGIGRKGTIDRPYLLNAPFWTVDTLFYLTMKAAAEIAFVFPLLQRVHWKKLDESTGVPSLSKRVIETLSVYVPDKKEQRAIGNLFFFLDTLIAATQDKIDALEQAKKALLQRLFDQSWRFKGYSDPWEKRKLGELAEFINGRAYKQDELLTSGKYPVLRVGNFYTNDKWYYSDLELPEKYYAEKGDLLYTWSATFGPHIWIGPKVIYHYHIWKVALKNLFEKDFALQFFEADRVRLLNSTNGSTMIHVTKKDMESKGILLPDVYEQRTIGELLKRVDDLIAATQSRLSSLELLKKALLQDLFI